MQRIYAVTLTAMLTLFGAVAGARAQVTTQAYVGWDAPGHEIASFLSGNQDHCAQICLERDDCSGAVYNVATDRCSVKDSTPEFSEAADSVLLLKILDGRAGIDDPTQSAAVAGQPAALPVDIQQITNVYSLKCIDVAGSSHSNGAKVQQYTCHGGLNQQFRFEPFLGTQFYQLKAVHSGKCLQVAGLSMANGAKVEQAPCDSLQPSQIFEVRPYEVPHFGYSYLVSGLSGKCVAVAGFSKYNYALIVQTTCSPNSNQLWVFTSNT